MKLFLPSILLLLFSINLFSQNKYLSYENQKNEIEQLIAANSDIAEMITLGESQSGKEIFAVAIGEDKDNSKPAFLVVAGIEPDDITSPVSAQAFLKYILDGKDSDSIKTLINKFTLYVIPRISPDPLETFFADVKYQSPGNFDPDDEDRDGAVDEDGYNDLNNDKLISFIRIEDPDGKYIEDEDLAGFMREADLTKGEIGKYIYIPEGLDDDKDGQVNEDPVGGVNANRNFTNDFKPYTTAGGTHPFSANELRAFGNFVFDKPNIVSIFSFTYHNNILKPWKIKYPNQPGRPNIFSADSAAYTALSDKLNSFSEYDGDSKPDGDISGWAYYDAGRFSFTEPAWTYPEVKDSSKKSSREKLNREEKAFKWILANEPEKFIQWKEIKHPDFSNSKVQLGGIMPFALNNAPEEKLNLAAASTLPLLYNIYKSLPLIEIAKPVVEDLGNNVKRVNIIIENKGAMPSHTIAGRKLKSMQPVLIRTKLQDTQTLSSGKMVTFIQDPIPGGGKIEKSFLIVGKGTVEFEIGSKSFGTKKIKIDL